MNIVYPPADLYAWAQRIYGPAKRLLLTPYSIPVDFGTFTPLQSKTEQVQIQSNADFVLLSISGPNEGSPALVDILDIQISDSATGEQFGDQIFPAVLTCDAGESSILGFSYPRWIGGNTALSIFVRNVSVSDTLDNITFTLRGVLIREY